jgi:hypothetical protein
MWSDWLQREIPEACAECGKAINTDVDPEWPPPGTLPVYCSSRCRLRAWRRRQGQRKQEEVVHD